VYLSGDSMLTSILISEDIDGVLDILTDSTFEAK
jgi:hypothetical protein